MKTPSDLNPPFTGWINLSLIIDEPKSALDLTSRGSILNQWDNRSRVIWEILYYQFIKIHSKSSGEVSKKPESNFAIVKNGFRYCSQLDVS